MHRSARACTFASVLLTASCNPTPTGAPQENRRAEPAGFSSARAAVLAALKDPDSAHFGPLAPGKSGAVCGTVNARNSFGGYAGMRAFAWAPDGRLRIYNPDQDWGGKGWDARAFAELGCSIGPDQARALEARRLLDKSFNEMRRNNSD